MVTIYDAVIPFITRAPIIIVVIPAAVAVREIDRGWCSTETNEIYGHRYTNRHSTLVLSL